MSLSIARFTSQGELFPYKVVAPKGPVQRVKKASSQTLARAASLFQICIDSALDIEDLESNYDIR